jgi:hypothetical protein
MSENGNGIVWSWGNSRVALSTDQYDLLLHVLLTHREVKTLLKKCGEQQRVKREAYVVLHGQDRLSGRALTRKLGGQEFIDLLLPLVDASGRGAELKQEMEFLAKMMRG